MPAPIDILEALLFASDTPLEPERIREVLELPGVAAARELVEALRSRSRRWRSSRTSNPCRAPRWTRSAA